MRYEVVLGFDTKQWWIYDNQTDEYIDLPILVLSATKQFSSDTDEQGRFLKALVFTLPEWLYDKKYRYCGNMEI